VIISETHIDESLNGQAIIVNIKNYTKHISEIQIVSLLRWLVQYRLLGLTGVGHGQMEANARGNKEKIHEFKT
jgi:hypothetical protein